MKQGAFYKPQFQRDYVWNQKQASRFIESLLMGLPVPGIFVYRLENGKHLIIDGLQRLTTLQWFYEGLFKGKEFTLTDVREPWNQKTHNTLPEADRLRLDDAIVHTTVFKQDFPDKNHRSVYEVFERINTGGMKLSAQEIRVCVNFVEAEKPSLMRLISQLNDIHDWRAIYGAKSLRLKDQELILRFLALKFNEANYQRPLRGFLDDFAEANRNLDDSTQAKFKEAFSKAISTMHDAVGTKAFRPQNAINAAVFDSVLVAVSDLLNSGPQDPAIVKDRYEKLLRMPEFQDSYSRSTADEDRLKNRLALARSAFGANP